MLVSVNEVSERLKISTRAVQIKCKRAKLKKIGNRYQITEEMQGTLV
jgi:Tfp pilus assembly protein PilZ